MEKIKIYESLKNFITKQEYSRLLDIIYSSILPLIIQINTNEKIEEKNISVGVGWDLCIDIEKTKKNIFVLESNLPTSFSERYEIIKKITNYTAHIIKDGEIRIVYIDPKKVRNDNNINIEFKYDDFTVYINFERILIDIDDKDSVFEATVHLNIHKKNIADDMSHTKEKILRELKDLLDEIESNIKKINIEITRENTFAFPSTPIMFTLLAMFSGKPERIPRKLLEKPHHERTHEEQKEAEEFLRSIIETKTETRYNEQGKEEITQETHAIVCQNPKVEAKAEILSSVFFRNIPYREEAIALHIKKTFGAEGLRHLLGFTVALEENGRKGNFVWNVSEHLERLGCKKKKNGDFDIDQKQTAIEILGILTSFCITACKKEGEETVIRFGKLFSIEEGEIRGNKQEKKWSDASFTINASSFWYQNALISHDGKSPQYTKLLKKVVQVNHREHPLTIYMTPLLAIFWRISPNNERKLSVKSLMEWCNLDYKTPSQGGDDHRLKRLKDLENELEYMKEQGFLGDWKCNGDKKYPSECADPWNCVMKLTPPEWLNEELKQIKNGTTNKKYLPKRKQTTGGTQTEALTREKFIDIYKLSGLTQNQFANRLGISRQAVNYIINENSRKNPSREISKKIIEKFSKFFV